MFQKKIDKESDKIIKITFAEKRPSALRKPSTQTGFKSCVLHTLLGGEGGGGVDKYLGGAIACFGQCLG